MWVETGQYKSWRCESRERPCNKDAQDAYPVPSDHHHFVDPSFFSFHSFRCELLHPALHIMQRATGLPPTCCAHIYKYMSFHANADDPRIIIESRRLPAVHDQTQSSNPNLYSYTLDIQTAPIRNRTELSWSARGSSNFRCKVKFKVHYFALLLYEKVLFWVGDHFCNWFGWGEIIEFLFFFAIWKRDNSIAIDPVWN